MTDDLDVGGKSLQLIPLTELEVLRARRLVRRRNPKEAHTLLYNILGIDFPKEHMPGLPSRKRWH